VIVSPEIAISPEPPIVRERTQIAIRCLACNQIINKLRNYRFQPRIGGHATCLNGRDKIFARKFPCPGTISG